MVEVPVQSDPQGADLDGFRDLVRAAFDRARASGKDNWRTMTTAVLKNRILSLTSRQFSERDYGSDNFAQLLRRIPDLVQLRGDQHPLSVHFVPRDAGEGPASPAGGDSGARSTSAHQEHEWLNWRVRDDLWRAVVDYDSGTRYVLNPTTGLAEPRAETGGSDLLLPTVDPAELHRWRAAFVEDVKRQLGEEYDPDRLEKWVDSPGATVGLPLSLRGRWNEQLKRNVSERLRSWLAGQGLAVPDDLLVPTAPGSSTPGRQKEPGEARRLRDFVLACVAQMSHDELLRLTIPIAVAHRVARGLGPDDAT